ncbi:hypothetical protein VNO78_07305 [Psophocarpus tetragonolobus]|uniref:Uncharacterized protein n=1 Tax=Psophocarpus tetragonolobus TaxID=3891 RepID=A0AAN9XRZ6_PSOTE
MSKRGANISLEKSGSRPNEGATKGEWVLEGKLVSKFSGALVCEWRDHGAGSKVGESCSCGELVDGAHLEEGDQKFEALNYQYLENHVDIMPGLETYDACVNDQLYPV